MSSDNQISTYRKLSLAIGLTALAALFLGILALISPTSVRAMWPFASAQAANEDAPVIHDPTSVRLLAAAMNPDPNPEKGDGDVPVSEGAALMAAAGPDGSTTPVTTEDTSSSSGDASNSSISLYTVKDGDSISGIASHFGISVNTILWANGLTIRSKIKPGTSLVILPVSGVKHTVAKGETLSSIAASYHASADEIATFNGLDADATVVVGDDLIIPGGEQSAPTKSSIAAAPVKKPTITKNDTGSVKSSVSVRADLGTASSGGYFTNPVPGAILTQGIHGKNAVDLGAPSGTPIHAAAAGTVIVSKDDGGWNGGYGSYVVISHANGTQTLYAHMSKDTAAVGESVSQGEIIGYVGETGEATGNHLHFEVRGGRNPLGYSCQEMSPCY